MKKNNVKIIAEIGINHNGSFSDAKELIKLAANERLFAIKFQYRNLGNVYFGLSKEIGDEILSNEINKNYLSPVEIYDLATFARKFGLKVGISFFDEKDIVDFNDYISIFDFFKVPSVEFTNLPLINSLLKLDKYLYLSLGAQSQDEIERIFDILPDDGWMPLHLSLIHI